MSRNHSLSNPVPNPARRIDEPSPESLRKFRDSLATHPPARILILGREHMGDLVNSTGAIDVLKRSFPNASLTFEGGDGAIEVLRGHPAIDTLWGRPRRQGVLGKLAAVTRYREGNFDLAVVLDDSRVYLRLARLAGIPLRVGVKRKAYPDYTIWTPFREDVHETKDLFQRLLETMGLDTTGYRPRLTASDAGREELNQALIGSSILLDTGVKVVGIHPSASTQLRTWPADRFKELIKEIQRKGWIPVLTGGENDTVSLSIARALPDTLSLAGKLSPLGLVALMEHLDALVVGDTGPMHVAAACEVPLVALYGPSDPNHTGPYGMCNQILLGACECGLRSLKTCRGTCLRGITVNQVLQSLETILT